MSELHLMYRLGLLLRAEYRVVRKAWRRRVRRWRLRNWYPAPLYHAPGAPIAYPRHAVGLHDLFQNCYTGPLSTGLQNAYARIESQQQLQSQQQLGGLCNALANGIPGLGHMIGN